MVWIMCIGPLLGWLAVSYVIYRLSSNRIRKLLLVLALLFMAFPVFFILFIGGIQ